MLKHISTAVQINKLEREQVRSCQWKRNENSKHHSETPHKVNGHIHVIQLNMINYRDENDILPLIIFLGKMVE